LERKDSVFYSPASDAGLAGSNRIQAQAQAVVEVKLYINTRRIDLRTYL